MKVKILMNKVRLGIDTRMKSGEYDNLRFAGKKLVRGYRKNLDLVDGWMDLQYTSCVVNILTDNILASRSQQFS